MKSTFKELAAHIRLFDGMGKPKINFQTLYTLFPQFTFTPSEGFGGYINFGEAYEQKVYDMIVTANEGRDMCYMKYREYQDANENLAYVS